MEKGVLKLGGVTVYSVLAQFNAYNVKSIEAVLAAWMIVCAGKAVVAKFAGASGRMGKALVNALKKNVEYKVIGTNRDVDVTDCHEVHQAAEMYRPSIIINCASVSDDVCSSGTSG